MSSTFHIPRVKPLKMFYVYLVLFCLLSSFGNLSGQGPCELPFSFEIQQVEANVGQHPSNYIFPGVTHRYYKVYLKSESILTAPWEFNYLAFAGMLKVNGFTSYIDKLQTDDLLDNISNPYYQYLDFTTDGEVTWTMGIEEACMEPGQGSQSVTFPSGTNSLLLFTLAVRSGPGEVPSWTATSGTGCDQETNFCNADLEVVLPSDATFPAPDVCTTDVQPDFEMTQDLQGQCVIVFSLNDWGNTSQNLRFLDGVIHLEPNMLGISNVDFLVNNYSVLYPLITDKRQNMDGSFDIFFSTANNTSIPIINTNQPLLAITVGGQYSYSQGGTIDCTLTWGRIAMSTLGVAIPPCSIPTYSETVTCPGYDECPNMLEVTVSKVVDTDCSLGILFDLTHNSSSLMLIDGLKLVFLLKAGNNSTIAGTPVVAGLGSGSLWSFVETGDEEWTFTYENTGVVKLPSSGARIFIPFTVSADCIDYYVLYAEANTETTTPCALRIDFNFNDKPACDPKLFGEVILDDLTPAPAHNIQLFQVGNTTMLEDHKSDDCESDYTFCTEESAPFQLIAEQHPDFSHCLCQTSLTGVSTFDMVLINRHILNIQSLNGPRMMLAADANEVSTGVSVFDIAQIRQCILGVITQFPNASSWKYVKESLVFTNPLNPFSNNPSPYSSAAKTIDVPNPPTGTYGNFYAIKTGDVNLNCDCSDNRLPTQEAWLYMNTEHVSDKEVRVGLQLHAPINAVALQFALQFDPEQYKFRGIVPNEENGIGMDAFSVERASKGDIRFAWFPHDGVTPIGPDGRLFDVLLEPLGRQDLSAQPLKIAPDTVLYPTAYADDFSGEEIYLVGRYLNVTERSNAAIPQDVFVTPNPATDEVVVRIDAGNVGGTSSIFVYDLQGRAMTVNQVEFTPNLNAVPFSVGNWPTGTYRVVLSLHGIVQSTTFVKI